MECKWSLISLFAAILVLSSLTVNAISRDELICPCPNEENASTPTTLYPDPANCSKYLVCGHGELVEFDCPPGLQFNSELKVCFQAK